MPTSKQATLTNHAIADMFPRMSEQEYEALKADIQVHGMREPITLHDGRIVDGRHRYRACCELGIEPKTRDINGDTSLVAFVVSENLHRRHLTSGQKAAVAVEAAEFLAAEEKAAKERQRNSIKERDDKGRATKPVVAIVPHVEANRGKARDKAAELVGTSPRYVSDAKRIKDEAPDLHKEVHLGTKTLPQARNELRKREKLAELEQKAKEAEFENEAPSWTLIHDDVLDGLKSVLDHHQRPRLIFADPPYNIGVDYGGGAKEDKRSHGDYLNWFGDWLHFCHELLAPDGSLWVMIGDEYAAEYAIALKRIGFTVRSWIKWYESFGVNCSNNFNRTSRHIFYCVKNPKTFVFNESAVTRESDRQAKYGDKRANPGGKIWDDVWGINPQLPRLTGTCDERIPSFPTQLPLSVVLPIVECASDPGDLVVDPFNGSGTTGVACLRLGRKYIGIDKSEVFIDLADKRLRAEAT